MNKSDVKKIIENTIKLTKYEKIKWERLLLFNSENNKYINHINNALEYLNNSNRIFNNTLLEKNSIFHYKEEITSYKVDIKNSYYAKYKEGFLFIFALFVKNNVTSDYTLNNYKYIYAFQSSINTEINIFEAESNDILRLRNIVESYYDKNQSFIDSLLNE